VDEMGPTWLETFNNKTRKLDNGWFAVKLPAGGDLSWDEARKQEREFFRDNDPWKSIPGGDRNRLGSEQLTQYISKLLSTLVAARCVCMTGVVRLTNSLPSQTSRDFARDYRHNRCL
jgi:hypothetical protein